MHGFAPGHCQHGLSPELATNNFPLFQTRSYQVRDSFLPTVRRLQCRVLQMTLDVIDLFLLEILRPILWGASDLHFICAHGHHHGDLHRQSLENVFQAAGRFDASKQHRRSIRRFADHGSVQWPLLYGPETVRVPRGNAVQVIPAFFVISFSYGNCHINGTKQLGTMMPCMTHDNSFYYAKFHANGTKKLGTMMVCITYVISCYFGSNTSSCILLHHIASSCIAFHRLASSCNVLHYLASSCIVLQRLAASSHHVTNIQIRSQKQLMSKHIFG